MTAAAATAGVSRWDEDGLSDAMLDLAEQAIRTCVDNGLGVALGARAARLLPAVRTSAPVHAPAVAPPAADALDAEVPPGALTQVELSQILAALKAARASRLTPAEQAANVMARERVLAAMRGTTSRRAAA